MTAPTVHPQLNALLHRSARPLILAHKHPDADAVGSVLGWCRYLRENGWPAARVLLNNAPGQTLTWLPDAPLITVADSTPQPQVEELLAWADLLFFLDFNTPKRMGDPLTALVSEAQKRNPTRPVVLIDHHPDPDLDCATLCVSEPYRSATCEVLAALIGLPGQPATDAPSAQERGGAPDSVSPSAQERGGAPVVAAPSEARIGAPAVGFLSPTAATALLTGIAGDTGLFAHNCNRPELFRITAALMEAGADKDRVTREVFRSDKIARQQLLGYILNEKIAYYPEFRTALFALSQAELDRFGLLESDIDGLVNYPLSARGIEISVFLRENHDDGVKISFRSEGHWPVNQVAREAFGGGGHLNAAGAEYNGSLQDATAIVLTQTRQMVTSILNQG